MSNIEENNYTNTVTFKSKLEDESFIDLEMIYSFGISVVLHIVIFYLLWQCILINWGNSYKHIIQEINKTPDLIFRLAPGKEKKGEYSFEETKKIFNLKDSNNNKSEE